MGECSNTAVRDALPDLLHGRLSGERLAEVQAHVDACASCRAELQLLALVRRTARGPRIDVARTVSALPAYRRAPAWRRALDAPAWRLAAAVVLLAGGAAVVLDRPGGAGTGSIADSVGRVAASVPVELSLGETFQDVSDTELRELVDVIDTLDAVLPAEPNRVAVPIASLEDL